MRKKSIALFYEIKSHVDAIERDVNRFIDEIYEEDSVIIDIKTCLNSENDILITVIYEYEVSDN